ncbi:MAG: uracil-DNA glycosylase [Myxococcales bacterium]|nr:uracil-DNA glycosylase [Myxococcales bacterium]
MSLQELIPADWRAILAEEFKKKYWAPLEAFVDEEYQTQTIYPPREQIFAALEATPYADTKVFLLGQDPYHQPGQAHGLCFSVSPGVTTPPSLKNIYKELQADLGCTIPNNGYLMPWAKQGLLMLNAVLTVRDSNPNSHKSKGWEKLLDAIIKKVNEKEDRVVFLLWGGYAKKKAKLVTNPNHVVIEGVHPSPLSASGGFFGSKPFSAINKSLEEAGKTPIDWQIPNL